MRQYEEIMFRLLLTLLLIVQVSLLIGTSIHISEDTIWSPTNNPIILEGNVFVDEGATLTILPGTHIMLGSVLLNNDNYVSGEYFMLNGEDSDVNMFWVNGNIQAMGTDQNKIIFTRDNNEMYNHWGTIYFDNPSQKSSFNHCIFEYSSLICIDFSNEATGTFSGEIENLSIRNCRFKDNYAGINLVNKDQIEITNNLFYMEDGINPNWMNGTYDFVNINNDDEDQVSVAFNGNYLPDSNIVKINNCNTFMNNNILSNIYIRSPIGTKYYISNNYLNSNYYLDNYYQHSISSSDEIYLDDNFFISEFEPNTELGIYFVNGVISNNSFDNVDVTMQCASSSLLHSFINNNCNNGEITFYDEYNISNSIFDDCELEFSPSVDTEINNCFFNITANFNYLNDILFRNCFMKGNYNLWNIQFQNCITTNIIPEQNNAGGNIEIDDSYLDSIYVDYEAGNYHLLEGSIAIDAGFDSLNYYQAFDLDYNQRVIDGNGDSIKIIDIGPYEFNSTSLGGIEGYTFNPDSGEQVDYVLLTFSNSEGKFTFSDSLGNYQCKLPAGFYNISAKRIFYEETTEYNVEVVNGEFTQCVILLSELVNVEDIVVPPTSSYFSNISNFPNPFNPSTTIHFDLLKDINEKVKVAIFNIKGQKIVELIDENMEKGPHLIFWNGKDSENNFISSGIYFYKISADESIAVNKMILLK